MAAEMLQDPCDYSPLVKILTVITPDLFKAYFNRVDLWDGARGFLGAIMKSQNSSNQPTASIHTFPPAVLHFMAPPS
jgi:hypothetical protein